MLPPARKTSARGRSPRDVDPNATIFQSTVLSVNGGPPPSTGQPPIQAPPGTVVYRFEQLTKAAMGARLSLATPTLTLPATGLRVVMQGVVRWITIVPPANLTYGTPFTGPLPIIAYDDRGMAIGGPPYANAVTVCDFDSSSHTWLVDNTDPAHPVQEKCVPVTGPNSVPSLTYDGAAIPPFPVAATNLDPASANTFMVYPEPPIVLAGTVPDDDANGGKPTDPNYRQDTLTFTMRPQLKSFSASQQGNPGPFKFTLDASCGSGANAIVAVTTTDNVTFNAAALNSGLCFGTVSGLQTSSHVVWFAVP